MWTKKGKDYKVRQHVQNQKVWNKTQTKLLQTLDRAEKMNKNPNKQTCKRNETTWKNIDKHIVSWDTNWKITEILITCMASANVTTVIRMVGFTFKNMHASLH